MSSKKDNKQSDNENDSDMENFSDVSDAEKSSDDEYETIDVTDNPIYQVLSAFFETEDGKNVCDLMQDIKNSLDKNTKMMQKLYSRCPESGKTKK